MSEQILLRIEGSIAVGTTQLFPPVTSAIFLMSFQIFCSFPTELTNLMNPPQMTANTPRFQIQITVFIGTLHRGRIVSYFHVFPQTNFRVKLRLAVFIITTKHPSVITFALIQIPRKHLSPTALAHLFDSVVNSLQVSTEIERFYIQITIFSWTLHGKRMHAIHVVIQICFREKRSTASLNFAGKFLGIVSVTPDPMLFYILVRHLLSAIFAFCFDFQVNRFYMGVETQRFHVLVTVFEGTLHRIRGVSPLEVFAQAGFRGKRGLATLDRAREFFHSRIDA